MRRALTMLLTAAAVLMASASPATAAPGIRGHLDTTAAMAGSSVTFTGHGVLTGLGRSHMTASQTVGGDGKVSGSGVLTAANGATVVLAWSNVPVVTVAPGKITFAGTMTVSKGTGRLAGRTGSVLFTGGFSFATSKGWMELSPRT